MDNILHVYDRIIAIRKLHIISMYALVFRSGAWSKIPQQIPDLDNFVDGRYGRYQTNLFSVR